MNLQRLPNETAAEWYDRIVEMEVYPSAEDFEAAASPNNTEGKNEDQFAHDRHFEAMCAASFAADCEDQLLSKKEFYALWEEHANAECGIKLAAQA